MEQQVIEDAPEEQDLDLFITTWTADTSVNFKKVCPGGTTCLCSSASSGGACGC
jgi:hypothetical protein